MALVLKTIEMDEPGANKIRGSEEVRDYCTVWRGHKKIVSNLSKLC